MANQPDRHLRAVLPIPDVVRPCLTNYDAKDPDTSGIYHKGWTAVTKHRTVALALQ